EPLGTEHAAANFDASLAGEGGEDGPAEEGLSAAGGDGPTDVPPDGPGGGPHLGAPGDGPGDHGGPADDGLTAGVDEAPFGAGPEVDPGADAAAWHDDTPFPPELDLTDPPEPVDGYPWSDPSALGPDGAAPDDYAQALDAVLGDGGPDAAELAQYD